MRMPRSSRSHDTGYARQTLARHVIDDVECPVLPANRAPTSGLQRWLENREAGSAALVRTSTQRLAINAARLGSG